MKTLYHVPIMHEAVDEYLPKSWEPKSVNLIWQLVRKRIENLEQDLKDKKVAIYQDSWCHPGNRSDVEFLKKRAQKGSKHSQIVVSLVNKGATLRATESIWRVLLSGLGLLICSLPLLRKMEGIPKLLDIYRERYIAAQIDRTLKEGEVGILFLGLAHVHFPHHLDADILVKPLISDSEIKRIKNRAR